MTLTRRQALALGLLTLPHIPQHQEKGATVGQVVFYSPHPDDETLSMGLAMVHYLAAGFDVHLVSMNRGGNGGPLGSFNGGNVCNWGEHAYLHDPLREGYPVLTATALGEARLKEARSALGAMSTITPNPGVAKGQVFHHEGGLPDAFGSTPTAVADAQAVIAGYVAAYPAAFHHTMSPTDDHPDHAACGQALRNLKNSNPNLSGARFFISRLYWGPTPPRPADVQAENPSWFPTTSRKDEFYAVLRNRVAPMFAAWNPAAGSYAIGYHQVVNQFLNNFGPSATIACLWHD